MVLLATAVRMATQLFATRKTFGALGAAVDISDLVDRDLVTLAIVAPSKRLGAPLLRASKESGLTPVVGALMSVEVEEPREGATANGADKLARRLLAGLLHLTHLALQGVLGGGSSLGKRRRSSSRQQGRREQRRLLLLLLWLLVLTAKREKDVHVQRRRGRSCRDHGGGLDLESIVAKVERERGLGRVGGTVQDKV